MLYLTSALSAMKKDEINVVKCCADFVLTPSLQVFVLLTELSDKKVTVL